MKENKEKYFTSQTADEIKNCFLIKLNSYEKQNIEILKSKNVKFEHLYYLFTTENFIKYEFRNSIKLFDVDFQKETELFFNLSLKDCLDKFSSVEN
jgi:hypothetical protein